MGRRACYVRDVIHVSDSLRALSSRTRSALLRLLVCAPFLLGSVLQAADDGAKADSGDSTNAAPGTAHETDHGPHHRPQRLPEVAFKDMDTDANGALSLAEFTVWHHNRLAYVEKLFGTKWTIEMAARYPSAGEVFNKLDADADGSLTPREMRDGARKQIERYRRRHKRHGKAPDAGAGAAASP